MAVFEVWKSGSESLDQLLRRDPHHPPEHNSGLNSHPAGESCIDSQIEELVRAGIVNPEIAVNHAMDPRALAKKLGLSER